MLRLRRYRVFVILAIITVLAFYKLHQSSSWDSEFETDTVPKPIANPPAQNKVTSKAALQEIAKETNKLDIAVPAAEATRALVTPPPVPAASKPAQKEPPPPANGLPQRPPKEDAANLGQINDPKIVPEVPINLHEHGEGREEVPPLPATVVPIHWESQVEHFPVTSTIPLPSGSPKPIPRIQHEFKAETPEQKKDRESKLAVIREHFSHAWKGYKERAFQHDELSPVSGNFRDPFAGWRATLVDALDTIWIMGLKEDFEYAVNGVKEIDFTTTTRSDIPLFETTIRYLGGLLAAYDVSERKYPVLLDKAVELGDILMGAFDTPNRMPITYYMWRPAFASQPHRASNRIVLAEIGTLSMEFTRLAQFTKEPRYYDAIARITDLFEEWQNSTRVPGMWPTILDASGCSKPTYNKPVSMSQSPGAAQPVVQPPAGMQLGVPYSPNSRPAKAEEVAKPKESIVVNMSDKPDLDETGHLRYPKIDEAKEDDPGMVTLQKPDPIVFKNDDATKSKQQKRQLDEVPLAEKEKPKDPGCDYQGFASTSQFGSEQFTLGGMSDSMYEYLPKEWLLLGGLVDQYKTMYEKSADAAIKHLVYRPMTPTDEDILYSGQLNMGEDWSTARFDYENAHLTCFAGGMFAMGAKIFEREKDLDIGRKLAEGCVYAYNVTASGIMPESYQTVPCDDIKSCTWNETKWWRQLDPYPENRMKTYDDQMKLYSSQVADFMAEETAKAQRAKEQAAAAAAAAQAVVTDASAPLQTPAAAANHQHKRQLDDTVESPTQTKPKAAEPREEAEMKLPPSIWKPIMPLTHKERVQQRIQEERLPPGFTHVGGRKYILRPEAIESVFYMYRITGEQHWRDAGWRMFEAVAKHTRSEFGHSAIDDIMSDHPAQVDEMESFWLAETLKYFYLLFEKEDVISLDDWVLNTEAHPFKRPKKMVGE